MVSRIGYQEHAVEGTFLEAGAMLHCVSGASRKLKTNEFSLQCTPF
jgi:hypothetical protein